MSQLIKGFIALTWGRGNACQHAFSGKGYVWVDGALVGEVPKGYERSGTLAGSTMAV